MVSSDHTVSWETLVLDLEPTRTSCFLMDTKWTKTDLFESLIFKYTGHQLSAALGRLLETHHKVRSQAPKNLQQSIRVLKVS